jgi:hypothetical protein
MHTSNTVDLDYDQLYRTYRGKCKEMAEELCLNNPTLRLVRGYYHEPMWSEQQPHWWTIDENGIINDPSRLQFPSRGIPEFYEEFDGTVECAECGKTMIEEDARFDSNYAFCSTSCIMRFVGL